MSLPLPTETTTCIRLDALRTELADFAYVLERQGRLDAADAVMAIDARVRAMAGEETSTGSPAQLSHENHD